MVVVKIELWPGGDKTKARMLGYAQIANDDTGDARYGNYDVKLSHSGRFYGKRGVWKAGRVVQHYREFSPYHLVIAAFKAALRMP